MGDPLASLGSINELVSSYLHYLSCACPFSIWQRRSWELQQVWYMGSAACCSITVGKPRGGY